MKDEIIEIANAIVEVMAILFYVLQLIRNYKLEKELKEIKRKR